MPDANDTKEFVLKEYEVLRSEVAALIADSRSVERNAVLASTAIWSWLLVHPEAAPWATFAKWLPAAFCLLSGARALALGQDILHIAEYLHRVETTWGSDLGFRWEHFIARKRWYVGSTTVLIFVLLVAGNIWGAYEYSAHRSASMASLASS